MNIKEMQRNSIKGLEPYNPGLLEDYLYKLDANESGYDIPPAIKKKVLKKFSSINFNRYPDPGARALKAALAKGNGVKAENIILGNGSDELIHYLIQAFTNPGDKVVSPVPSFDMYRILALANGAKPVLVPLDERFDLDEKAMMKAAKGAKLMFLAYPNNPTGNCFSGDAILRIIRDADCLVVLDEAYFEFSNKSFLCMLKKRKNLVILRTFSKAYSMAGLRLGYMMASPEIIDAVNKVRLPYNVNSLTQACAVEMLKCPIKKTLDKIMLEKEIAYDLLKKDYPIVYGDANFLLIKVEDTVSALKAFKKSGISVRAFGSGPLSGFIRLTIGKPEENKAAIKILKRGV